MNRVIFLISTLCLGYISWFLIFNYNYLVVSCIDNFDRELLALGTESAKSGCAVTGAYSRLGFRHPGPFLFYYLALFDGLFPFPFKINGTYKVAILTFNFITIFTSSYIAVRILKLPILGIVLFPSLLLALPNDSTYLADYWNPRPVSSLFILSIISLVATIKNRRFIILSFISLLISFHLHLGALFGIIPLSIATLIIGYRYTDTSLKILCAILIGIFIAPIFLEIGNLKAIISISSSQGWSHTYAEVYELVGSYFRTALPFLPRFLAITVIITLGILGAERQQKEGKYILALSLSVIPFIGIGAFKIYGPLHQYLLSFGHGVVAVIIALGLCGIIFIVSKFLKRDEVLVASYMSALIVALNLPSSIPDRECGSDVNVPKYVDALSPSPSNKYKLNISELQTRFAPKILLELIKRDINVCVQSDYSYLYGEGLVCDESPEKINLWLTSKESGKPESVNNSYQGTRATLWW